MVSLCVVGIVAGLDVSVFSLIFPVCDVTISLCFFFPSSEPACASTVIAIYNKFCWVGKHTDIIMKPTRTPQPKANPSQEKKKG